MKQDSLIINNKIVGNGDYQYVASDRWGNLPNNYEFKDVCGLATDENNNVYVLHRDVHPVLVLDEKGNLVSSWGENDIVNPHSIRISQDGSIFIVDRGQQTIKKYTKEGELLLKIGRDGYTSNTGATGDYDYRKIVKGAEPFNLPTDVAIAQDGEIFVSDGYGNARIHRFSPEGKHIKSWGAPGDGKGEFHIPHNICIGKNELLYVGDRENSRIQIFNKEGEFIDQWTCLTRPNALHIDKRNHLYVAEFGYWYGLFWWMEEPRSDSPRPCISVWSLEGELLSKWGSDGCGLGEFCAPHAITVDNNQNLYVGELILGSAKAPEECHRMQKFTYLDKRQY